MFTSATWKAVDCIERALLEPQPFQQVIQTFLTEIDNLVPAPWSLVTEFDPKLPESHQWHQRNFPQGWFENYPQISENDFVREAAMGSPHVVIAGDEVLPSKDLKKTELYQIARTQGLSIEHIMAVSFPAGDWGGGVAFFREPGAGFSEHERRLVAEILPSLRCAFRMARRSRNEPSSRDLLSHALNELGTGLVLLSQAEKELLRTEHADELLQRWFPLHERKAGLPEPIAEQVRNWMRHGMPTRPPVPLTFRGNSVDLLVGFHAFAAKAHMHYFLSLQEKPHEQTIPEAWLARLTPREAEVAGHILNGRSNEAIAMLCGCAVHTVKKHIQRIFDKLGVPSRSALCNLAMRSA